MCKLFFILCGGFISTLFSTSAEQKLDQFLQSVSFQGSALIAREGKIILHKGYGFANLEHKIPNDSNTVYRIGSVTKQFTGVLILQLQEQGLLDISDPISKYLPTYPNGNDITIHHLLCHTSGIAEVTDLSNLSEIQRHPQSVDSVIAHFKDLPLRFSPGSCCVYTNSGYIVLGAIIEKVLGQPYGGGVSERLFKPLQLQNSYYDHNQTIIPHRASGYAIDNETLVNAEFVEMSFPHAAGALASTTEDLYRWTQALFGNRVISKKSMKLLTSVHAANKNIAYGYGLRIGPKNQGFEECETSIIGHFGSIEGFVAALIYYPDSDTTIILLSNREKTPLYSYHKELFTLLEENWRPVR